MHKRDHKRLDLFRISSLSLKHPRMIDRSIEANIETKEKSLHKPTLMQRHLILLEKVYIPKQMRFKIQNMLTLDNADDNDE